MGMKEKKLEENNSNWQEIGDLLGQLVICQADVAKVKMNAILQKKNEDLEADLREKDEMYAVLQKKIEGLEAELREKDKMNAVLQKKAEGLEAELREEQKMNAVLDKKAQGLAAELRERQQKGEGLEAELREVQKMNKALQAFRKNYYEAKAKNDKKKFTHESLADLSRRLEAHIKKKGKTDGGFGAPSVSSLAKSLNIEADRKVLQNIVEAALARF